MTLGSSTAARQSHVSNLDTHDPTISGFWERSMLFQIGTPQLCATHLLCLTSCVVTLIPALFPCHTVLGYQLHTTLSGCLLLCLAFEPSCHSIRSTIRVYIKCEGSPLHTPYFIHADTYHEISLSCLRQGPLECAINYMYILMYGQGNPTKRFPRLPAYSIRMYLSALSNLPKTCPHEYSPPVSQKMFVASQPIWSIDA